MLAGRAAPLLAVCVALGASGCASGLRRFVDRPVAWAEHDDESVSRAPRRSGLGRTRVAIGMLDLLVREVDRTLSIEWRRAAALAATRPRARRGRSLHHPPWRRRLR